jgi:hypothetical protein
LQKELISKILKNKKREWKNHEIDPWVNETSQNEIKITPHLERERKNEKEHKTFHT